MAHWIRVATNVVDVPEWFYGPYPSATEAEQALKDGGWENYRLYFPVVGMCVIVQTAKIIEQKRRPVRYKGRTELPHRNMFKQ